MNRRLLALGGTGLLAVAGFASYFGSHNMGWFDSSRKDLARLLGVHAAALMDDSTHLAAWSPDTNYKPQSYYAVRDMDEAAFRNTAARVSLQVAAVPAVVDAIWRLPAGVALPGWSADSWPLGAGLQFNGTVGGAAVWMRWHQGRSCLVVLVSGA